MPNEVIRTKYIQPVPNTFCPGCLHSMSQKVISEVLEELGVAEKTIAVIAVGCCSMSLRYIMTDKVSASHGRAPAVATGLKRVQPDSFVYCYQGDGDLASIGLSEVMAAANRGEKFTIIFANNSTYGMTGGQLAPTSLVGQVTTTTPKGRSAEVDGYPLDMCAILSTLKAPSYIARVSFNNPANTRKAKEAIRKAFQNQIDGKAFSFVEILTNCVTNWNCTPLESLKFIEEKNMPVFPLGVYRDE